VRRDIKNALSICAGELKITNDYRELMSDLTKGQVVGSWKKFYKIPDGLSVNQWIIDLAARVKQLTDFSAYERSGKNLRLVRVWVGGLFIPEAYITATRQAVAQSHKWALEQLRLSLDFRVDEHDVPPQLDDTCFFLTNMRTQGAVCAGSKVSLTYFPFSSQPLTVLRWHHVDEFKLLDNRVDLPIYLNATRTMMIFRADVQSDDPALTQSIFYERGVCLICSSLSGLDEQ
jgi:dynein heavy chain 1